MLACSHLSETLAGTTPGVQNVLRNFLAGIGTTSLSREDRYLEKAQEQDKKQMVLQERSWTEYGAWNREKDVKPEGQRAD